MSSRKGERETITLPLRMQRDGDVLRPPVESMRIVTLSPWVVERRPSSRSAPVGFTEKDAPSPVRTRNCSPSRRSVRRRKTSDAFP